MYRVIQLDLARGGTRDVALLTTGRTSYYYQKLFGKDLMASIGDLIRSLGPEAFGGATDTENIVSLLDSGEIDMVSKLAFIMNGQAEGREMQKQNFDTYLEWMDLFDSMAFVDKILEIIDTYLSSRTGSADLKKNPDRPTGR